MFKQERIYILSWFKSVTSSFDLRNNNNINNNFINMPFVVVYKKIIGDTYLEEIRISHNFQSLSEAVVYYVEN